MYIIQPIEFSNLADQLNHYFLLFDIKYSILLINKKVYIKNWVRLFGP